MNTKWIVLGATIGLVLCLTLVFLKPQQQERLHEQKQFENINRSTLPDAQITESLVKEQSAKQNQEMPVQLLQQREQVYQQFQAINTQLSQGQQPDQNKMINLLEQQYALVQKGVVKADEAISYIQYLRQILPEMDRFLDRQQAKLEQLKN